MSFDFTGPGRIVFGEGVVSRCGQFAGEYGDRAVLVRGGSQERARAATVELDNAGLSYDTVVVTGEPTTQVVEDGATAAREAGSGVVVAVGGGSVLDAGKAIAALATNPGPCRRYVEVIGEGMSLDNPPLPSILIPTTAGTGSECTANAVVTFSEEQVKVSLRSTGMLAAVALTDPRLTWSMPPLVTASTGLDALTQLIEPFVSPLATPITDGMCREGIRRAAAALPVAHSDGGDAPAREAMALASMFGGLALANAKLGAVHGLAGPIGGSRDAPHGAVCGRLLPIVVKYNVRALRDAPASSMLPARMLLARFDEVAVMLIGDPTATADEGVVWLEQLCTAFAVPGLASYGFRAKDLAAIADQAAVSSSMKGNPAHHTRDALTEILDEALRPPFVTG